MIGLNCPRDAIVVARGETLSAKAYGEMALKRAGTSGKALMQGTGH